MWGLDLDIFYTDFSELIQQSFDMAVQKNIERGYIKRTDNKLFLTDEGALFSDQVIMELMI